MLAATHALTGAIIASQVHNPAAALTFSLLSHPLLDLFPHWDYNTRFANRSKPVTFFLSMLDAGSGIFLGLLLFADTIDWRWLLLNMIVALLPDILEAPYHFGASFAPFSTIKNIQHHWHTKLHYPWGFIPQVAIWLLAFYLGTNQY